MPLTVNINLDVPDLPDNDVWWANNAAWVNYWANIDIIAEFDPAVVDPYSESAYVPSDSVAFNYDGVDYSVPTTDMFDSLLAAYQALNASYKSLRTSLIAAGFIEE